MLKRAASKSQFASSLRRHASTFQRQSFSPNRAQVVLGISAASLAAIGVAGLMVDRGTHMWLEYTLALDKKEIDSDTREWGWELEAERWTGDPNQGGTDSYLPSAGRKAVRNAWFSHHRPEKYGRMEVEEDPGQGTNMVDAVLLRTELCLRGALTIAEKPDIVGRLHPCTLPDILTRRASILERLGPAHLPESRAQYDRVFRLLGGKGLQAARIAVKIGDLNQRLGEGADALAWWARAVQLVGDDETITSVPAVPPVPPSSPAAQRILASALVSTSAFYGMTRQLRQAQTFEEDALDLLRSIRPPESLASASPPQALHALSLLHRSAVLSLHLSEVLYAQRAPVAECVMRLQDAATSSERVAYALAGTSVPDSEKLVPSAVDPLGKEYLSNPYLEKPASDLLRDARRSAADAWNLMGELTEKMGPSHRQLALGYYTRALAWAGRMNKAGKMEPAESTLRDDWRLLWKNYARMKRVVDLSESK
ncbi:hypothetical protein C8F04DRAFT_1061706 [Mycena alexandri]|uniref:Uncharacterized protein n=1 Tax=Mycena alexandri TaxID=1745969 RepID=A0AAD6XG06_9AGAR|nr:hypothetical protein C8F04DRAFT_1061706 [Mycena alexandri]